ncbi:toprim domain-containing protein [Caulobacter segnis]
MSLRTIVRILGGDLYDGGRRANVPAPGHSRRDRSVSLLERDGRLIIHTFGGADWRTVRDDLRARGLLGDEGAGQGQDRPCGATDCASRRLRRQTAEALWSQGRAITATLSERHCRLRGMVGPAPDDTVLRHHGLTPLSVYRPGGATRPALLAGIVDAGGALSAIEITYLGPGGRRAVDLRLPRKTVGIIAPGSAVRLDPAAETMLVAEGVFTTLSARRRFGLPAWALLSTSNLRFWRPPCGVRSVLIAADRGQEGEASAKVLARALRADGVEARITLPPAPFGDWNELDMAEARAAALVSGERKE